MAGKEKRTGSHKSALKLSLDSRNSDHHLWITLVVSGMPSVCDTQKGSCFFSSSPKDMLIDLKEVEREGER